MDILKKIGARAKSIGGRLLSHILSYKVCRNLVKRLIRPEVVYQWETAGETERGLLCKVNSTIIARVNIYNSSSQDELYQGWWIFGMWVNWRYRGLGIGRRLTEMACDFAAGQRAPDVKLLVFKDNKPALNLYQKMGFYQVSIPKVDEELKQEAKKTHRQRIIMKKDL